MPTPLEELKEKYLGLEMKPEWAVELADRAYALGKSDSEKPVECKFPENCTEKDHCNARVHEHIEEKPRECEHEWHISPDGRILYCQHCAEQKRTIPDYDKNLPHFGNNLNTH